jgi:D-erythrulose 1-phosphate 3-epimerase
MEINLGINTGFALNRYTTPEQWIPLVREQLGIKRVQFTADLLNPSMPDSLVMNLVERTRKLVEQHEIIVESAFTSAFTRVNHFSHPDAEMREYWVNWFKKFIDIAVLLGAESVGSHFGILTVPDLKNKKNRNLRFQQNVDCWKSVAEYGKQKGLLFLTWETMSIPREYGETISEARKIQDHLNQSNFAIPMLMCLDVDHGDLSSDNPDDTDPYVWLETFGSQAPQVHLKQSLLNKGGHWSFTPEYNAQGKIIPEMVLKALKNSGAEKVSLLLELSFREREPFESRMLEDLKQSVQYWKKFC